jgi:hypothetical protein
VHVGILEAIGRRLRATRRMHGRVFNVSARGPIRPKVTCGWKCCLVGSVVVVVVPASLHLHARNYCLQPSSPHPLIKSVQKLDRKWWRIVFQRASSDLFRSLGFRSFVCETLHRARILYGTWGWISPMYGQVVFIFEHRGTTVAVYRSMALIYMPPLQPDHSTERCHVIIRRNTSTSMRKLMASDIGTPVLEIRHVHPGTRHIRARFLRCQYSRSIPMRTSTRNKRDRKNVANGSGV